MLDESHTNGSLQLTTSITSPNSHTILTPLKSMKRFNKAIENCSMMTTEYLSSPTITTTTSPSIASIETNNTTTPISSPSPTTTPLAVDACCSFQEEKNQQESLTTSNHQQSNLEDKNPSSLLSTVYLYISVFLSLFLQIFKCESMFMLVDLDALYPTSPSVEPLSETFKDSVTTTTFDSSFSSVFSGGASLSDFTEQPGAPPHVSSLCNIATSSNLNKPCKPSLSRKSSIVILLDNAPIPCKESRKMSISLIELDTPTSIYTDDLDQDFDTCSSSQCMSDAVSTATDSLIDIDFLCCNVNTFTPPAIPPRMFHKTASSPKFLTALNPKDAFVKQNSTSRLIRSNVNREEIFELKSRLNSFKFPVKDDE